MHSTTGRPVARPAAVLPHGDGSRGRAVQAVTAGDPDQGPPWPRIPAGGMCRRQPDQEGPCTVRERRRCSRSPECTGPARRPRWNTCSAVGLESSRWPTRWRRRRPSSTTRRNLRLAGGLVRDCGYHCAGQSVPAHICDPMAESAAPRGSARCARGARRRTAGASPQDAMATAAPRLMSMDEMTRDMRNRFLGRGRALGADLQPGAR